MGFWMLQPIKKRCKHDSYMMKKTIAFLPALIWTLGVLILTLMPSSMIPETTFFSRIPYFDKMVHCFIFAGFVLLWCVGFRKEKGEAKIYVYVARMVLIAIVLGLVIELLQKEMPGIGRAMEWWDWVADMMGAFLGAAIFMEIYGPKKRKEKEPLSKNL